MAQAGSNRTLGVGCAGLFGLCMVSGVAMQSAWLGGLLALAAFVIAGAIGTGRVGVARKNAVIAGAIGAAAAFGTFAGINVRHQAEERAEADRARAAAQAQAAEEQRAALSAAAPGIVAEAGSQVAASRAAIAAGNYDEAHSAADQARTALASIASLVPPAPGAADALRDAEQLRADAANLRAIAAALEDARDAAAAAPGDDPLLWDAHLETLATTLRGAPAVAVDRFGPELTRVAEALDRQRQRYRRQVERAERELERAERNAQRAVREAYASTLDRTFIQRGLEVQAVEAAGDDATTLRIRYALCGRVFLDRIAGDGSTQGQLRRLGFRRIECRSGFDTSWIDLSQ